MKLNNYLSIACLTIGLFAMNACSNTQESNENKQSEATNTETESAHGGQSGVVDNESAKDVVKVAVGSPDHTTLVKAVQAAGLVDVLSNAGPFTVFAPVNTAFEKLPAGTVEGLLKPESKNDLANILQYHVAVPIWKEDMFKDGQKLGMANGGSVIISKKDGKLMVNDANILGSVMASNGIVYVIDKVLLPSK